MEIRVSPSYVYLIVIFSGIVLPMLVDSLGVNYGQLGNNLPSPEEVVPLVKSIGATKIKLYDANPTILKAFANTGIEIAVGLGNEYLSKMRDPVKAQSWIKQNVQPYLPATNITCITVGNEVLSLNDTVLSENLLPAMQGVYTAIVGLGLYKQISITTAHSLSILQASYPPSAGRFGQDAVESLTPILDFHRKTGSPFLINAYPFFAYKGNPKQIPLDFVLFQSNPGTVDPGTGLRYDNMLYAQIDAVYSALAAVGYKTLLVQISETGWPSKGDADEYGATVENARKYNGNLIKTMTTGKKTTTPMRPNIDLDIYVFALFNENMKPGPTSERNYGLFKPDRTPAYSLGVTLNSVTNGSGNSSSGVGGANNDGEAGGGSGNYGKAPAAPESSATGYLSISSSTEMKQSILCMFLISMMLVKHIF